MPDSVTDVASLKQFLQRRTKETWDERQGPYYLSFVATDLKTLGIDYRALIGPVLKLSQWAATNEIPDTMLVVHPTQKARIGFVPSDSGFAFEVADAAAEREQTTPKGPRSRALVQFVQSLMNLPDESLESFQVPAKTLVALLRHR